MILPDNASLCDSGKTHGRTGVRLGGFFRAVSGRLARLERIKKLARSGGDLRDRGVEGGLVRFRRLVEAADLADELERRCANFILGDGRSEIEEHPYISAHRCSLDVRDGQSVAARWRAPRALLMRPQPTECSGGQQRVDQSVDGCLQGRAQ